MWARQFSERAGVVCPNQAAEHYYLITGAMPDVDPSWPVIEDPSKCEPIISNKPSLLLVTGRAYYTGTGRAYH